MHGLWIEGNDAALLAESMQQCSPVKKNVWLLHTALWCQNHETKVHNTNMMPAECSAHLHDTESTITTEINTFTVKSDYQLLGSWGFKKLDWELARFGDNMIGWRWQFWVVICKKIQMIIIKQLILVHWCTSVQAATSQLVKGSRWCKMWTKAVLSCEQRNQS